MMYLKNILALTVLISFTVYKNVQCERVYGVDIPRVNISAITGKWFMVASSFRLDASTCVINEIQEQSPETFTMHVITTPNKARRNPKTATADYDITFNASLQNESNIISTTYDNKDGPSIIIFDAVSDSHLCMYITRSRDKIPSKNGGVFSIYSRERTLSNDDLETVRDSDFYQEAFTPYPGLHRIDATAC